jgi:hypothetical protein
MDLRKFPQQIIQGGSPAFGRTKDKKIWKFGHGVSIFIA